MRDRLKSRLEISPSRYAQVTLVAVAALSVIVLTGAAVRLTGSGLGCPDWPKCYGRTIPPLQFHTVIEFGNRMVTAAVGLVVIAAAGLSFFRRPYRRHLAILGFLLPLGVVGQAVLGGLVVRYDLNPYLVMSHFILSMLLLDASFALAWCAAHEPGWRAPSRARPRHLGDPGARAVRAADRASRHDGHWRGTARGRALGAARQALHFRGPRHAF